MNTIHFLGQNIRLLQMCSIITGRIESNCLSREIVTSWSHNLPYKMVQIKWGLWLFKKKKKKISFYKPWFVPKPLVSSNQGPLITKQWSLPVVHRRRWMAKSSDIIRNTLDIWQIRSFSSWSAYRHFSFISGVILWHM